MWCILVVAVEVGRSKASALNNVVAKVRQAGLQLHLHIDNECRVMTCRALDMR